MSHDCHSRQSARLPKLHEDAIYSQMTERIKIALRRDNREEAYRAVDRAAAQLQERVTVAGDDHVSALGLDRRTCTILENGGIEEVRQLEALTIGELKSIYSVGPDLAEKIVKAMRSFGKALRPSRVRKAA